MKLYEELSLNKNKNEVISFVGGGGKTTSIKVLAKELSSLGLKVLITTTTMIFEPIKGEEDNLFLGDIPLDYKPNIGTITILGSSTRDGKLIGCDKDTIDRISSRDLFNFILVEADGAKRKPIKAPESYEPVICNSTTMTIGVIGIDAIGLEINGDNVHRPERLKEVLSVTDNHLIDHNDLVKLALHPKGIFKSSRGRKVLFINKIKVETQIEIGKQIKEKLKDEDIFVLLGDIMNKLYY